MNTEIKSYKDLIVWQKSIELVTMVYQITDKFPKEEMFGLTNQIRRAAISIASNIAEGKCRGTKKDYSQFLHIAFGSGAELETQLIISKKLGYIKENESVQAEQLLCEVMKMLNKLISNLK